VDSLPDSNKNSADEISESESEKEDTKKNTDVIDTPQPAVNGKQIS
jgi:hypothetical protein